MKLLSRLRAGPQGQAIEATFGEIETQSLISHGHAQTRLQYAEYAVKQAEDNVKGLEAAIKQAREELSIRRTEVNIWKNHAKGLSVALKQNEIEILTRLWDQLKLEKNQKVVDRTRQDELDGHTSAPKEGA